MKMASGMGMVHLTVFAPIYTKSCFTNKAAGGYLSKLSCQPVFFQYLFPMSSGVHRQADRQRPCLELGIFGPQMYSVWRQVSAESKGRSSRSLHKPTWPHTRCNPSYKAGTLFLLCTVKYCMLFLSSQYSTEPLKYSNAWGLLLEFFYKKIPLFSLRLYVQTCRLPCKMTKYKWPCKDIS